MGFGTVCIETPSTGAFGLLLPVLVKGFCSKKIDNKTTAIIKIKLDLVFPNMLGLDPIAFMPCLSLLICPVQKRREKGGRGR
jgi:hypothetical protein